MPMNQAVVPVTPGTFGEAMRIGEVLAESGFFSDTPTAAKAIVKMLAGRELGFGPIASMTGVDIIQGQVAVKPKLLASAIQRSPRFRYKVVEHDEQHCAIDFYEDGELAGRSTFTMADATKAALAGKDSWRKYPRNMLWARAMSNGANWYCAAIFGGPVYTPEEFGADVDAEGEIVPRDAAPPGAALSSPSPSPAPLQSPPAVGGEMGSSAASDGSPEPQAPEPQPETSGAADGPSAAPSEPTTPAQIMALKGFGDATQRMMLIEVGVDDVGDLDAAYASLTDEQQDKLIAMAQARAS
jgi:hypothetical protein